MVDVLLLDDESELLGQAKVFLEREDDSLDVKTTASAEEALELLEEGDYDAIVSDYQMPEMDGLEFLEVVRKERNYDIPFIIFTGKGREEVAIEALNLGANRYLQKGTDPKSQYGILADAIIQEVEYSFLENRLQLASFSLENADVGTLWISPDGEISYANKQICQWLGYDRSELTEMAVSDIDPNFTDERPEIWEEIKGGGSVTFESQHRTKNGGTFPVRITSHYLERNGREYEFAFVHDITEAKRRAKELRERRRAVEASDDSIYMIDRDFRYVFANDEHLSRLVRNGKIPRKEETEVVGEKYESVHAEEELENFKKNFQKVVETGGPMKEEYQIKSVDRWSGRTYSPVENPETGEIEGVVVVSKDITERKRAEERFQHLFQNLGDAVFVTAAGEENNGEILEVNETAIEETGWTEDELIGMNINDWLVEGPQEMTADEAAERLEKGESVTLTTKRRRKDGSTYWVEETAVPIDYGGKEANLSIYRDVTDRVEAEKELRKTKDKLSAIYESSSTPITLSSLEDGRYVEVNEAFSKLTGWEREEAVGKTAFELGIWPEASEKEREKLVEELREKGSIKNWEVRFQNREGGEGIGLVSAKIIQIEGKEYMLSNYIDITELKEAEERLERVKERYEELFKEANELIVTTDPEGYIKSVNRKTKEISNYSENELTGENILKLAHPDDEEKFIEGWNRVLEGKLEEIVVRIKTKEEDTRWLKVGGRPIIEDGEVVEIQYTGQDITELKKAEKQARLVKERFEELFEGANEGIITTDEEGYIKRVNKRAEEIGGYSEGEIIGNSLLMFAPPDERESYIENWHRILDGEETVYEQKISTKDGRTRHVRSAGRPIKEDGEIVEIQYNFQDITERVKSEEREKFLHSLLRHDVRNKAQVVEGYLDFIQELDLSEEYEKYLERAIKATEVSIDLIEKVRTLRRIEGGKTKEVDLEPLIREAVESCKSTAPEMDFQVEMKCPIEGCVVKGGPLLEELFSNLLENSVRHSGGSKVRISNRETEEEMICIVEDDGKGIPDEEKEDIFERRYKRGENAGSGLGMYLVKGIAESYGGHVEAKDSEMGGAHFDVHLQKTEA